MSTQPPEKLEDQVHDGKVEKYSDTASSPSKLTTFATAENSQQRATAERALTRKLDTRFLPTIVLIYIMNYIDRTAITSAKLKGMEKDLKLSDLQYDAVIAILFASYCPMQVPSNMLLNKVPRPSLFIGGCVIAWGVISALTGITKNQAGIMACRVFLGLPEVCTMYLLSRWYTRKQLAFRSAILFSGLLISNAFGSLMAAGILGDMEGKLGIRAWRWLFYIEGAITICVGLFAMWALPDYPHNTRWMNHEERHLAQTRLAEEVGESDRDGTEDSAWSGLKMAIVDTKVQLFMLMSCCQLLGMSFVQFFPTLAKTLGFSTTITLLLAAPPWVLAAVVCVVNSFHADKSGERFFHTTGWFWATMLGYIISLSTMSLGGRYASMFLMAVGYGGSPILVWASNVITRPPAKRAAALGLIGGFANTGSLIGAFIWKAAWGPKYHQSMEICFSALAFGTVISLVIRHILIRENRKLDVQEVAELKGAKRERIEEYARLEGITFEEALERNKGFRYIY